MKKIIASILVLLCITTAYGQEWNTSGANIVNSNTGNVGIGYSTSTAPPQKLSVNGSILIPLANGNDNASPALIGHNNSDFNYDNLGTYLNNYGFGFFTYNYQGDVGTNAYMSGYSGLSFFTDSKSRLRINRNGNIGVNNPTPLALLDIKAKGTSTLLRSTDESGRFRWRVASNFHMYFTDTTNTEIVKIGQDENYFKKNVAIGYGGPAKAQIVVGHNFGASISGSGSGQAMFGSNLAVYNSGSNVNKIYTPHDHPNAGYSGMRASYGRLDFYTQGGKTKGDSTFSPIPRMTINTAGNVVIGTASAAEKLTVAGSIFMPVANNTDNDSPGLIGYSDKDFLYDDQYINDYGFGFHSYNDGNGYNGINSYVSGYYGVDVFTGGASRIRVNRNGNVGIGTAAPDQMLTVKGKIHTQEVIVDLLGAVAPDYVFEKSYDLLSLEETEAYIEENKHLPEIPSAKEMDENGVQLKEMNLLLLKKIEELTLHLIEQNKRIETLEKLQMQK